MKFGSKVLLAISSMALMATTDVIALDELNKASLRGGSDGPELGAPALTNQDPTERLLSTAVKPPPDDVARGAELKKAPASRRVIVRYKAGRKQETVSAMTAANNHRLAGEPEIKVEYEFDEMNTFVINAMEDEIAELVNSPEVEGIEDDPIRYPMNIEGSNADLSEFFVHGSRKLAEDLPQGIGLVQAPDVWAQDITGEGVKVCVIDTGIDGDHPDFETSKLTGSGNTNARNPWNEDGCGHGTHVSGTIAAVRDTKGVVGVAPDAEIFTVRVFGSSCGIIFGSSLVNAARKCRDNGAKIVSMSLGGPVRNFFEELGFNSLVNNDDMLIIAAAGNSGDTSKSFPASYGKVMSVAAVNATKGHAFFSQRNDQVDIAAPGVNVLSTFPVGGCNICQDNTDGYGAISGTSMATPHVSGVAALLMSAFPDATNDEIRAAIEASAEDLGANGRDDYYGHGFVQANDALRLLRGEDPPATDPISGGCTNVAGWHDSDGEQYDCEWYSQGTRCSQYGNRFANDDGLTANDACCECGGGETAPSEPIGTCGDSPQGWHDDFGSFYDCDWYAEGSNCERFGDGAANDGKTANDACCACGGGKLE